MEQEEQPEILKIDSDVEKKQISKLKALREKRDVKICEKKLGQLRSACTTHVNIMPALIECAHAYCTIGEIARVMRDVFGEYHDPGIF